MWGKMKARAECECGRTNCPQHEDTPARLRDAVRTWLVKLRFARIEHGNLICPICRTAMHVRIDTGNG